MIELRFESLLAADSHAVWRWATSVEGIGYEMAPLLRMTFPRGMHALPAHDFVPGQRLCRSWLLLLCVLPVDWSDLTLVELEPGRRFLERSPMLSMAHWQHERTITPAGQGTVVVDSLTFRPRRGLPRALVRASVALFFRHRHARLRRRFGAV
jgi:ligand-binding SRPBCC domain-containing protein